MALRLRAATWNIHGAIGSDGRYVPDRVVEVLRFERTPSQRVVLKAQWNIISADGRRVLKSGRANVEHPVEGTGFESTVAAMSHALADLSREIASGVKALPAKQASS